MTEEVTAKIDIEAVLKEGKAIQVKPQGYSMYPLFVPGRDEAVIRPVAGKQELRALKRGDVVLYRRKRGILVLHRIWKTDGKRFYMVGDNQSEIEGPLEASQIKGKLEVIIRKGHYIETTDLLYRFLTGVWLWLRPARPMLSQIAHRIKVLFGRS